MPLLPIPLRWRAAACDHCGESVRHISLGRNTVTLNPRPVSVLAERFGDAGAVTAYEHRVGYEAHHCTSPGRGANTEIPDSGELSGTRTPTPQCAQTRPPRSDFWC